MHATSLQGAISFNMLCLRSRHGYALTPGKLRKLHQLLQHSFPCRLYQVVYVGRRELLGWYWW